MQFNINNDTDKLLILDRLFKKYSKKDFDVMFQSSFIFNPIISINKALTDKMLDEIYIFRLFEFILNFPEFSNKKGIRLTQNGWLNLKFCKILYELTPLSNELIDLGLLKKIDESSNKFIEGLHEMILISGVGRKYKNHLIITKKGKEIKKLSRIDLLEFFLDILIDQYSWSNLDGFKTDIAGQFGFLWILINLKIFGDQPIEIDYYYQTYINLFPKIESSSEYNHFSPREWEFGNAFSHRTFENILIWLNIIKFIGKKSTYRTESQMIQSTPMLDNLFIFN